jgi:tRNA(Ile)-lysidine synthase
MRSNYKINMKNKVINTIKKYNLINANDKVILGVSGGPDSLFMLDILNKIKDEFKFEIVVAHFNHMIREEANDDENFVVEFCKKIGVKCYTKRIDVKEFANTKKIGTEEAGRILRYSFFEEVLKKENANKIAIAHNKNDKVETIIMNTLRGSGISGLKGIEAIRDNKYIRPIIEIDRCDIEKYCEENKLNPRIDKTNFENTYTRNKIRNVVIPYIKQEFNPNIIETITRLSEVISEEDEYLKKKVKEEYEKIIIAENKDEIILDLKKFNKGENALKKRIIIYAISKLKGSSQGIEKIHIEDIVKLCNKNIGNKYLMPNKYTKIFVNDGKIYIYDLKK